MVEFLTDYKTVRTLGWILFIGGGICFILGATLMFGSQNMEYGRCFWCDPE